MSSTSAASARSRVSRYKAVERSSRRLSARSCQRMRETNWPMTIATTKYMPNIITSDELRHLQREPGHQ